MITTEGTDTAAVLEAAGGWPTEAATVTPAILKLLTAAAMIVVAWHRPEGVVYWQDAWRRILSKVAESMARQALLEAEPAGHA